MITKMDKLTEHGCSSQKSEKICRSRGGESCAFDGAMIVLQPIADAAHIVHGPIACCGNSWEGRGALSNIETYSNAPLHKMGFTTDMSEMDIVYGSEEKLYMAILQTYEKIKPKAIFVYATCVSGLIGEDIEAVCKKASEKLGICIIPVNAPGFIGPKNLGNRIAGEVLLEHVIGTGIPPLSPLNLKANEIGVINIIGEYNIAGDLWLVEPILKEAGIRIMSRITGNSTFQEITYAHMSNLNVIVCSRALINVAKEMQRRYGIPFVEVSFFGKSEMSRALRLIASRLEFKIQDSKFKNNLEEIIEREERLLDEKLIAYEHLKGKKAVLYSGGVKSWSFISALHDLAIEIVAVGTKKSTFEDEEKMKQILGENAPLVEDVTPKNLLRLMKERNVDILIAGGRNQYLAVKEGYPFVDINQERHTAYAGYKGLLNLAKDISNAIGFYSIKRNLSGGRNYPDKRLPDKISINPLKHSQSIGAAIALQGIDGALPIIHGAQGCTFLAKVLLTKHFKEPIALASSKLFTEDVVMGSDEKLIDTVEGFIEKNNPSLIGILTSGLSEVRGDDITGVIRDLRLKIQDSECDIVHIPTTDYEGGLEKGYAKAVEEVIESVVDSKVLKAGNSLNVIVGHHLTPADFTELREIIESFRLNPIMLPDLSALDGSRQGFSSIAKGGETIDKIKNMGASAFSLAIGRNMEQSAIELYERFDIEYIVIESISGLRDSDFLMKTLSMLSNKKPSPKLGRQRRVLIDGMRDAHYYFGSKKICLALEHDLSIQTSHWLQEMGADVFEVDIDRNDLFSIEGDFDLIISNSHAEDTAKKLGIPLYQMGFPVYKVLGNNHRITIGYRGTLSLINEVANLLVRRH